MKLLTALAPIVTLALLAAPLAAGAQQTAKITRIGYLASAGLTASAHLFDAFRQGLRELGWVEGQSITLEYRSAEGRFERLPDLAAELVRLRVDVIVVASTPAALAAKDATRTIPIVLAGVGDPVGTGLVESLARPGGNITGLSFQSPELSAKQLELLKEAIPKLSRVAVLSNPDSAQTALMLRETELAARALGVQLHVVEARSPDQFASAFARMTKERTGALLVLTDALFFHHRVQLADLAVRSRLPAMYGISEHAQVGGLMAYSPTFANLLRRSATYVDKILKGAKPADLPVEQPTKFELVVNAKTAKALGLTIPPSVLLRADEVIQ